ncbi:MAG: lytic transglycosylase domain-containing protein [Deltaproteobacteria bacterium]|nr:lytic transglycosylase domain-containing protein [Deltaproteobacteria bacterium]
MRFLRGWVGHSLGNDARAVGQLEAAAGAFPELEDYRLWALAGARLASGDAEGAARAAEELEAMSGSRFSAKAAVLRARALEAAGRERDAATVLTKLLDGRAGGGVDRPAARATLARCLEKGGDAAGAAREWRLIAVSAPESGAATRALEALGRLVPDQPLTAAERLRRAERLHEKNRHEGAIAELERMGPRPAGVRAMRLKWLRGASLYEMRGHYEEAARILGEVARSGGPEAEDAAFLAARSLSRAHHDSEAAAAFRRFARAHPTSARVDEALRLAALAELEGGRAKRGARELARLERTTKDLAIRQDARWRVGFELVASGKARAAIPILDSYAADADQAMDRARGAYWGAVARLAAKRTKDGTARLRKVVAESPLHFYGLFARQRLLDLGEDPGPPFGTRTTPDPEPPISPARAPTKAIETLLALGLVGEAEHEIGRVKGLGRQDLVALYRTAHATERLYRLARDTMGGALDRPPAGDARLAWALAYPRPHRTLVDDEARAAGLPEGLLWAIMRQESSFDPEVVSYANAVGLLQLLPSTARRVATDGGLRYEEGMLFEPARNIELGARYLGGLLRRFKGQLPLAIAAYNGGPGNVDLWLARFGDRATDEFVERIPFDQTRNYVRRVLGSYARYRYLYGGTGDWPIEVPMTLDRTRASGPDY